MATVEVDDLPEERDFLHAAISQGADFIGYFLDRPSTLRATGLGHDAKGAMHVAASH
jgi:hypothetical protein